MVANGHIFQFIHNVYQYFAFQFFIPSSNPYLVGEFIKPFAIKNPDKRSGTKVN
jgi:hypothetical protein